MSDDECYGPALPPGFSRKTSEKKTAEDGDDSISIGPSLPAHLQPSHHRSSEADTPEFSKSCTGVVGPVLPLNLSKTQESNAGVIGPMLPPSLTKNQEPSLGVIGPVLPPSLTKNKDSDTDVIGPMLPPHLAKSQESSSLGSSEKSDVIGPCLPSHSRISSQQDENEGDTEEMIGPLPSEMMSGNSSRHIAAQFERRAQQMRDKLEGKNTESQTQPKRESWMTELPDCIGQNIGLTARTFRPNAGPDMSDRSIWSDSPADRERKMKEKSESGSHKRKHNDHSTSSRDNLISKEIEEYNRAHRDESLMDMHKSKMKKKKLEEEDKPKTRRPFDREQDLQVNRFDEAQRNAIIKKSQNLNSRFGHSKDSHYL